MNKCVILNVVRARVLLQPQWFFYISIGDETTISMCSSEACKGLTICRHHSTGSTFVLSYFKTLSVGNNNNNNNNNINNNNNSNNRNIGLKEIEKKSKYKDLELEIQRMWHMETVVIPVVVGALGTVKKGIVENIKKVSERATVTEIQKICMLGSARILRKVLSV